MTTNENKELYDVKYLNKDQETMTRDEVYALASKHLDTYNNQLEQADSGKKFKLVKKITGMTTARKVLKTVSIEATKAVVKRSTWHVEEEYYDKIVGLSGEKESLQEYLGNLCIAISQGHYDHLIEPKKKEKSVGVKQADMNLAIKHLKGSGDSVLSLVKKIVDEEMAEKTN